MPPIVDHPLRYRMANELHARPFPSISAAGTAVFLALKTPQDTIGGNRQAERDQLLSLLDRYGAQHPQPGATHYSGTIGRHELKWEQHTEFVTYTIFTGSLGARAFDPTDFEVFPADWLAGFPSVRVTSILLRIETLADRSDVIPFLDEMFVPESLAVSSVLDDAAVIAADFRIDTAGHQRMAVFVAPKTGPRRVGRIVQRLCEIETYKSMSMLGFDAARGAAALLGSLDDDLTSLMGQMRSGETPAETALDRLLEISSALETMIAATSFRFGATGAYEAIVGQRIQMLREIRFEGRQTFAEFMMRRYNPAMRTVISAQARMQALSDRAIRVGELLRTKVDVTRSAQNQKLLESMDRRADMALRLQETVEGLSVVAISYYAVSLAAYLFYPLTGITGLSKGELTAAITLPVVLMVWWAIRRIRARLD